MFLIIGHETTRQSIAKLKLLFNELKDAVLAFLVRKSNDEEDFLETFQDGLVAVSGYKGMDFFSRKIIAKLRRSSSFENIFELLSDNWNFFNCYLLCYVIDNFTSDNDIRKKKEFFSLELTTFLQTTTVPYFLSVGHDTEQVAGDGTSEISVYMPCNAMTLEDVENLKEEITHQASFEPHTLFFTSSGNNILKWKVPKHLTTIFASAIDETFLVEHHIKLLQIDGVDLKSYIKQV